LPGKTAKEKTVAACALHTGAELVHADKHFDTIARHSNLQVESFVRAIR